MELHEEAAWLIRRNYMYVSIRVPNSNIVSVLSLIEQVHTHDQLMIQLDLPPFMLSYDEFQVGFLCVIYPCILY